MPPRQFVLAQLLPGLLLLVGTACGADQSQE